MARLHGSNLSTLTFNSQTVLADSYSLTSNIQAEVHDTTTFGDDWREFTSGLKDGGEISLECFYNDTATTGTYELFFNDLGTARTLAWSDGTNSWSVSAIPTSVSNPIPVGDMSRMTVTLRTSGAVTLS